MVGFDIEDMCTKFGQPRPEHVQLVVQDVLTLHGSQFKDAALIVASPPCQFFSYCAMPWTRAKELAAAVRADPNRMAKELALFDACFRIQREACEAAGRHIPMVVENVKGAQPWVGRARWAYGSFFLWGDVPALMPIQKYHQRLKVKAGEQWNVNRSNFTGTRGWDEGTKVPLAGAGWYPPGHPKHVKGLAFNPAAQGKDFRERHTKNTGGSWFNIAHNTTSGKGRNPDGRKLKDQDGYERNHPAAFGWKAPRTSSQGKARKFASAMIAKIPLPLSRHIARCYLP